MSLYSMTGYGEASSIINDKQWTFVVQSVNSRYLDCRFRLPGNLQSLEPLFKGQVKKIIERGKVDILLSSARIDSADSDCGVTSSLFNAHWVACFCRTAEELIESMGWNASDSLRATLLQTAFTRREAFDIPADTVDDVGSQLLDLLSKALDLHFVSRKNEGSFLANDFRDRITLLNKMLLVVEGLSLGMPVIFKDRLNSRIASILEDNKVVLDESRLCQEVAILSDKADISEEIVRFKAHISQFALEIESEVADRKGKKLEFLIQEMLREVNTIGSKANLLEITQNVVDIKNELEKMREQVQNVI